MKTYFADSQAFFAPQGKPPIFIPGEGPQLNLALLTSVPPFVNDPIEVIHAHQAFVGQVTRNNGVCIVRRKDDLANPLSSDIGVVLGLQHVPNKMTEGQLRALYNDGLRFGAIAYKGATAYGSGYAAEGGLTERGKWLIRQYDKLGITLDISYANEETAMDAFELIWSEGLECGVMASHSGCSAVYKHKRNISNEVLLRLSALDGYIGIPLITFLLHDAGSCCASLLKFMRHVEHAVHEMGPGKVGIGSDCPHVNMTLTAAKKNFERMLELVGNDEALGAYFPDRSVEAIHRGSALFELLERELRTTLNSSVANDILGRSFRHFLERSLPRV